jgi:hypothetical protein
MFALKEGEAFIAPHQCASTTPAHALLRNINDTVEAFNGSRFFRLSFGSADFAFFDLPKLVSCCIGLLLT